ncbi:MAG: BamA/TamA family outer membrane protein [Candidatus Zixiibacteriota bacterium]|nr:MAG: BamA/TamA family outer membrane protein [candidate division Zixibacteria bacterium]
MKSLLYILAVLWLIAGAAGADETGLFIGWDGTRYHAADSGEKIGLALSGGGARGLAQVGILKAFEESGIKIGAVAGTSIGGIVGGLYAAGYDAEELESIVKSINFGELFRNRPERTSMLPTQRPEKERFLVSIRFDGFKPYIPQALTTGQKLTDLLTRLTLKANYVSGGNFDRLKIPFRAVTTDIVSGGKVVLSKGNLADAMRSTMAFPLAFTGVESGNMILMDGGMVDPIPIDVVREIDNDLDLYVAVNTTSDLLPKDKINNPIDIANQATSIMTMDKLTANLRSADVVIKPHLMLYSSTDFDHVSELAELGYQAGLKAVAEIRHRLKTECIADSFFINQIRFIRIPRGFDISTCPLMAGQITDEKALRDAAQSLYRRLSLFSISLEPVSREQRVDGYRSVDLLIRMIPRPRISDIDLVVSGNTILEDSVIAGILTCGDSVLSSENILHLSDSLVTLYNKEGFDLAHIKCLEYLPDLNVVEVDIDEGIIEGVRITGNMRTKNWLVKSNFSLGKGRPLNLRQAGRGIANIYATDLFDRVSMNILPGNEGAIVRIAVKEKKYTQVRLGWHWHDEYKSEQFIELLDDNLFGTGQEFLIHLQYAKRRQKYDISLAADRFFSTYLTYRIRTFYTILNRRIYDRKGDWNSSFREDHYGFEFVLGQQIARFGTVTGEARWDEIENEYSPGGLKERIELRMLTVRSLAETINKYPFPTEGKKHLFYFQYATDLLGGETKYTKLFSSIESYFPFSGRLNFHPKLSIGITDTQYGIPNSEKFYMGGHYSFYGYRTDELVGAKMLLGNMEIRFRLPHKWYLSGRYDFGDIYGSVDQIKLRNIRHAFGFSLAYASPIGPIDFGYGKSGTHPDCFYIDVGLAF